MGQPMCLTEKNLMALNWWTDQHPKTPEAAFEAFLATYPTEADSEATVERRRSWFHEARRSLLRDSGILEVFPNAKLLEDNPVLPEGYRATAKYMTSMLGEKCLMALCGRRGTGKTRLACGLVKAFCACNRSALYLPDAKELFESIKRSFNDHSTSKLRLKYERLHLLVIDECQVRDSEKLWQDNELTSLINKRFLAGRATLLVSNLMPAPFMQLMGESVTRRLNQDGQIVEADWPRIEDLFAQSN